MDGENCEFTKGYTSAFPVKLQLSENNLDVTDVKKPASHCPLPRNNNNSMIQKMQHLNKKLLRC